MKSITSLFKKGIIISDLKRFWWVSALYALALFLATPMIHFMRLFTTSVTDMEFIKLNIQDELRYLEGSSAIFLILAPVIIGTLLFMYMQKSKAASMFHSLPLSRAVLYFNSCISAAILLVIPILFNAGVMFLLNGFTDLSDIYSASMIFRWVGLQLLFGLLFLSMTIFTGIFTGNSVAQVAFVYILNFLPYYLVEFVGGNLQSLLYGFRSYSNDSFMDKLPMSMLFLTKRNLSASVIVLFIILTIALFAGGLWAFKKRKPEMAGEVIAFRWVRPIFIFGVTTCVALLGGAYFASVFNTMPMEFTIFGLFLGSLLAYIIVQMITNKTFKVLNTYKGYLGFALVMVILLLGVKVDIFGYQNKVPAPESVVEVYFGNNIYYWENRNNPEYKSNDENQNIFTTQENIKGITTFHKAIVQQRPKDNKYNGNYLIYKLKNGSEIRRYYDYDKAEFEELLSPVYKSEEYLQNRYPILKQTAEDIKYIEIRNERVDGKSTIVSDKDMLAQLQSSISKDVLNLKYSDIISNPYDRTITIAIKDKDNKVIEYKYGSSYHNTKEFLQKNGLLEKIMLTTDEIASTQLINYNYEQSAEAKETIYEPRTVEVSDKQIVEELIELSMENNYDKLNSNNIGVQFATQNGRQYEFAIYYENVSANLQKLIDSISN